MKIAREIVLVDVDRHPGTDVALDEIRAACNATTWPPGSADFAIYPESGKKRGMGNGVLPIRHGFVVELEHRGWGAEVAFPLKSAAGANFGAMDAARSIEGGLPFMVEWETGNISSSHRAMNKLALGLTSGVIAGGVLLVPTKDFARYLTDRIGNEWELLPYTPLWQSIRVTRGYLAIFAVEHDREDTNVERIPKGTDGRALS